MKEMLLGLAIIIIWFIALIYIPLIILAVFICIIMILLSSCKMGEHHEI